MNERQVGPTSRRAETRAKIAAPGGASPAAVLAIAETMRKAQGILKMLAPLSPAGRVEVLDVVQRLLRKANGEEPGA
jgi:hypothetical protein